MNKLQDKASSLESRPAGSTHVRGVERAEEEGSGNSSAQAVDLRGCPIHFSPAQVGSNEAKDENDENAILPSSSSSSLEVL